MLAFGRDKMLYIALGDGEYLHNPVLTAEIAQDATLTHLRIQDEGAGAFHLSTAYAEVAEVSHF